jgi:hypothetical protein
MHTPCLYHCAPSLFWHSADTRSPPAHSVKLNPLHALLQWNNLSVTAKIIRRCQQELIADSYTGLAGGVFWSLKSGANRLHALPARMYCM